MTKQLGIAVVGCGYWGINYVRLLSELPETSIVAVCDQRAERLKEIKARFPNLITSTQLDDILSLKEVEAVIIATPATLHYEVASACLMAGKHVLVEKPMATTSREAGLMIDLAAQNHLVLMVGHIFLYNPGIQKVRSYIENGDVGPVYYIYSRRTNLGPIRCDTNALWDLASHDVSIMNYLLSDVPVWVSTVGVRVLHTPQEDVGFIALGYANDVVGHIHVSWAEPNKVRELVVVGRDKRVLFNDLNPQESVRIFEKGVGPMSTELSSYGDHQFAIRDGDIISPKIDMSEPLKNECRHFVDCVINGRRPLSDGANGLEVVAVMEAVMTSMHRNGAPIKVDLEKRNERSEIIDSIR